MEIIYKTIEKDEKYLRQKSMQVDFESSSLKKYLEKIISACKLNTNIFALASIQIGIPYRIICLKNTTIDIPLDTNGYSQNEILINPVVIEKIGLTSYWEACASCLDNTGLVERPYKTKIKYYNEHGIECVRTFIGFESTVLCHELDHLDGILHIDLAKKIILADKTTRKKLREKEPYKIINKTKTWEI